MTITDETPETIDGAARVRQRGDDAAVLRLSEAEAAAIGTDATTPDDDERVLLNMGPSHPSTHGVLRLMLEMEGETVIRSKPVVGYLHTGMEKQAEQLELRKQLHAAQAQAESWRVTASELAQLLNQLGQSTPVAGSAPEAAPARGASASDRSNLRNALSTPASIRSSSGLATPGSRFP